MTANSISEASWQAQIVDAARLYGWVDWHHLTSRGTRAGLPDLEILHRSYGRQIRVELKTATGHLTPAQSSCLDLLGLAGVEVHVWRPGDLDVALLVLATPTPIEVDTLWRQCRDAEHARMPPRYRKVVA